jgi:glyoxylase-like metal-dependent hydrolase (beta-lactamase superfamily II)
MLMLLPDQAALAQADLSGEWDHPGIFGQEDLIDRGQGPEIGDYLGLPLNEAGLRKAETYSGSWLSVPEHQCTPHPATYSLWGPGTLSINKEYDRVSREVIALRLDGTYGLDRIVWMDGRPHPSEDAPHTFTGFSTGRWDGDTLMVETSHLKLSWIRRNGTPFSERARMVEFFTRFDDYLMVVSVVDDPVYLSEPFIRTTEYTLNKRPLPVIGFPFTTNNGPVFYKCFPAEELPGDKYRVPHYLPGANPLLDEFATLHNIPRWTIEAGTETMYPDFTERVKQPAGPNAQSPRQSVAGQRPLAATQGNGRDAGIRSMHVKGKVWAVMGGGGNVSVQVGDEGVLVVDTGTEQMADSILAEIRKIAGDKPIRYVINTHWHADHTGGNAKLSAPPPQVQRAAIIAHENVGLRLTENKAPVSSLVMDTFFGGSKGIYFNGEPIEIIHVPSAHTDGDVVVFFRGSDVVSAGDILLTTSYPILNLEEGSSIQGAIDALNRIIDITIAEFRQQGGTMVVPGHGRLYDEADVVEYRDMLSILRDRIQDSIQKGKTLEQVKAERPTLEYDGVFGATTGFWTPDMFIDAAYRSLSARKGNANE